MVRLLLLAALIAFTAADVSHLFRGTKAPAHFSRTSRTVAPFAFRQQKTVAPRRPLPVAPVPYKPQKSVTAPRRPLPVAPVPFRPQKSVAAPRRPVLPVAPVSSLSQKSVGILKSDANINPDGSYHYAYETENGIAAEQQGQQKPVGSESANSVQGSFQYKSPEGVPVVFQYVADENGYQPQSDLLPTPPPVPAAILRALAWIAAHPQPETKKASKRF